MKQINLLSSGDLNDFEAGAEGDEWSSVNLLVIDLFERKVRKNDHGGVVSFDRGRALLVQVHCRSLEEFVEELDGKVTLELVDYQEVEAVGFVTAEEVVLGNVENVKILGQFVDQVGFTSVGAIGPDVKLFLLELAGLLYIRGDPLRYLEVEISVRKGRKVDGLPREFGKGGSFDFLVGDILLELALVGKHIGGAEVVDFVEVRLLFADHLGDLGGNGVFWGLLVLLQSNKFDRIEAISDVITVFDDVLDHVFGNTGRLVVTVFTSEGIEPSGASASISRLQRNKGVQMFSICFLVVFT